MLHDKYFILSRETKTPLVTVRKSEQGITFIGMCIWSDQDCVAIVEEGKALAPSACMLSYACTAMISIIHT